MQVIIQRSEGVDGVHSAGGLPGAWNAASDPFSTGAWALCMSALALLGFFVMLVSLFRPTPFLRSTKSGWAKFATVCARYSY